MDGLRVSSGKVEPGRVLRVSDVGKDKSLTVAALLLRHSTRYSFTDNFMHSRSCHVLPRLRNPIDIRTAAIATKPAVRSYVALITSGSRLSYCHCTQPLPTRNPGTPSTFSAPSRPPLNLGKWGRPEGFPQRFSDPGSSSPSRTSPYTFRERRTRGPADDVPEGRRNHRSESLRTAFSSHTKWKRPIPFPMPPTRSEGHPRSFPRDPAPHLSKSADRPFPSTRTSSAARSSRVTHEPVRHTESVRSNSEEQIVEKENLEDEISFFNYAREGLSESKPRRSKITHKERGSLLRAFRDNGLTPRNRNRDAPAKAHAQNSKPKSKPKALNKSKVEVFIPSIVSVGNLARILGVSLGGSRLHPGK